MIQRGSHISLVFMQVLFPGQIRIWKCWFLWREENWLTRREALGATREGTTNTTHTRHEPGPHWWEASALITALSLLPIHHTILVILC